MIIKPMKIRIYFAKKPGKRTFLPVAKGADNRSNMIILRLPCFTLSVKNKFVSGS